MPAYYVYWNAIRKRIRIHRAECGACNNGKGMHHGKIAAGRGLTYNWVSANSYKQARTLAILHAAKVGADVINCGLCKPQFSN